LNGSTRWPSAKELQRLGETRMGGAPARVSAILERLADSMSEIASVMARYIKSHPEFAEIGSSMRAQWNVGIKSSLKTSM
jgi:serine/threonine-protein kinase HipA